MVFDSYATGNRRSAKVTVVNQTQTDREDLRVRVRIYDLQGNLRADRKSADNVFVSSGGAVEAMTLPRGLADSPCLLRSVSIDSTPPAKSSRTTSTGSPSSPTMSARRTTTGV